MKHTVKYLIVFIIIGLLAGGKGQLMSFLDALAPGKDDVGTVNHTTTAIGGEADCKRIKGVVKVYLDPAKYPYTVAHAKEAFAKGQPRVWHLDRKDAEEHRDLDLKGIPTKEGFDRDEEPAAATRESANGSADVAYVPSSDNRGAGSTMGSQLTDFCEGQAFKLVFHPKPAG